MCIVLNCHMVTVCTIIKDYHGNRELYKFAVITLGYIDIISADKF